MGRKRKNIRSDIGINIDLAVIILFVVSILLFILIYGEKGVIGEILSPALGGIIGIIKYIIPIGIMLLAICVAKNDRSYIISKIIQFAVLISCIAATMSIYNADTEEWDKFNWKQNVIDGKELITFRQNRKTIASVEEEEEDEEEDKK